MRWVLLDEVIEICKGGTAKSKSHIFDTPYGFEALLVEMMAQTGALLLGAENEFKKDLIFAKIDRADFEPALPVGTQIEIEVTSDNLRSEGAWFNGTVYGPDGKVCTCRFLLMNVGHFIPDQTLPITFHNAFMQHYQIREKLS